MLPNFLIMVWVSRPFTADFVARCDVVCEVQRGTIFLRPGVRVKSTLFEKEAAALTDSA